MPSLLRFSLLCAAMWFGLSEVVQADDKAERHAGETLFKNVCAACHGPKGQGTESLKVPTIAARPAWYVERQLENFRAGRRGTNPAESQAMIMGLMAKALAKEQLHGVALYIASLDLVPPSTANLNDADVAWGKELFHDRCMECHRFNATGEMTFGSPPLVGLPPWYIRAQIKKFKTGERGAVPGDQFGVKMVLSSRFIESEDDLRGVIAYITSLNPAPTVTEETDVLFKPPPLTSSASAK